MKKINHSKDGFRIFFFSFEKSIKSHTIWICSCKKTTLKKFLDNRSKQFRNTRKIFFDKWGFQKLEKNLKKFIFTQTNFSLIC